MYGYSPFVYSSLIRPPLFSLLLLDIVILLIAERRCQNFLLWLCSCLFFKCCQLLIYLFWSFSGMYTFMIDISSNYFDSIIIEKCISLSWIILFALKPKVVLIYIGQFSYLHHVFFCVRINIFCNIIESYFYIPSDNLYLLIGKFNLKTFNGISFMFWLRSTFMLFLVVCHLYFLFIWFLTFFWIFIVFYFIFYWLFSSSFIYYKCLIFFL